MSICTRSLLFVVYANLKCLVKVNEQTTEGKLNKNRQTTKKNLKQFHIENKLLPFAA